MQIQPMVLQADKEKINAIAYKFKNDSELAVQITKLNKLK